MLSSGRWAAVAVAITGLFVAVLLFSQFQLGRIADRVRTLHDDRLLPLTQLKQISDGYAVRLVDVVNKANAGLLDRAAVERELAALGPHIEHYWQAYLATELTAKEQLLIAEARRLKSPADVAIAELQQTVAALDNPLTGKLSAFDGGLYQRIDPLTQALAELTALQLDVAAANRDEIAERTGQLDLVFSSSLLLTLVLSLVALFLLLMQYRHRRRIAELAAAQQQLQQFNQALSQQMAERTQALQVVEQELDSVHAAVAHGLQTPADDLSNYLSALREQSTEPAPANWLPLVERATRTMDRMNAVLNDLLALSRLERNLLRPEELSLSVLLEEALARYSLADRQRIRLTLQPLPLVYGDRALLSQLLQLLLDQALNHIANVSAPQLTVATARDPQNPNQLAIEVCDNGQPDADDSGISLALCTKILHLHGGRTWTERNNQSGSCVYFSLPDMRLSLQIG